MIWIFYDLDIFFGRTTHPQFSSLANKIMIENGKYVYENLYQETINILDNEVIATLDPEPINA